MQGRGLLCADVVAWRLPHRRAAMAWAGLAQDRRICASILRTVGYIRFAWLRPVVPLRFSTGARAEPSTNAAAKPRTDGQSPVTSPRACASAFMWGVVGNAQLDGSASRCRS